MYRNPCLLKGKGPDSGSVYIGLHLIYRRRKWVVEARAGTEAGQCTRSVCLLPCHSRLQTESCSRLLNVSASPVLLHDPRLRMSGSLAFLFCTVMYEIETLEGECKGRGVRRKMSVASCVTEGTVAGIAGHYLHRPCVNDMPRPSSSPLG